MPPCFAEMDGESIWNPSEPPNFFSSTPKGETPHVPHGEESMVWQWWKVWQMDLDVEAWICFLGARRGQEMLIWVSSQQRAASCERNKSRFFFSINRPQLAWQALGFADKEWERCSMNISNFDSQKIPTRCADIDALDIVGLCWIGNWRGVQSQETI